MIEHIAYRGNAFTIEWYFDQQMKSQPLNYYNTLPLEIRIKVLRLFKYIGDRGVIRDKTKFNYEGNQIFAFKPDAERFLCFFMQNKKLIVTNAFRKKQQKIPSKEKSKALENKAEYTKRFHEGTYYVD